MTDGQRCRTCRFWNQYAFRGDWRDEDRGYCELSGMTGAQRVAARIDFSPKMFCAERGCLDTEGDFGCLHWKAKP